MAQTESFRGMIFALILGALFTAMAWSFFTPIQATLIGLVALLVTLWTNESLPLGVVSLLPIILFPMFEILTLPKLAPNYANPVIFLFLGGFMLAIAIEKIKLHLYFSSKLLSYFPKTVLGILYSLTITSALLSSILSNTTITLMLMPIALYLSENIKLKIRFLLATAYGASIGGILTPIGTVPNAFLLGFLEDTSLPRLSFGEWVYMMFPIVVVMLSIVPWLLSLGIRNESVEDIGNEKVPVLDSKQRMLFMIIGGLALILIGNTFLEQIFKISLSDKLILLSFGLLMFFPKIGVLDWEDSRKIPYEIIMLFGAGFSIAMAFTSTGLASDIAKNLTFITEMHFFFMLLFVAFFVAFSTEVTSNTALTAITIPIFYEFAQNMPNNEGIILLMVATVAASYAFMLPIATPPNAIVMSSRVIPIARMAQVGFKANIIGILVLSVVAYFLWGMML